MGGQYTCPAAGGCSARGPSSRTAHAMSKKKTHTPPVHDRIPASPPAQASGGETDGTAVRLVAGAAIALVLALLLAVVRPATTPVADTTAASARAQPGTASAPPAPPLPAEVWREAFPLIPADIHFSPDELGAAPDAPGRASAVALDRALAPYRAGDYQKAAVALEGVSLDHPAEHRAALYLGVARLFIDEPQAAIESLRQAQQSTNPDVVADAEWYILVGIARLREPDQAEADAKAVCARGGPGAVRPCRAVGVLANARAGR